MAGDQPLVSRNGSLFRTLVLFPQSDNNVDTHVYHSLWINTCRMLSKMQKGRLTVVTQYGEPRTYNFGRSIENPLDNDEPVCEIQVRNPSFWLRLATMRYATRRHSSGDPLLTPDS